MAPGVHAKLASIHPTVAAPGIVDIIGSMSEQRLARAPFALPFVVGLCLPSTARAGKGKLIPGAPFGHESTDAGVSRYLQLERAIEGGR
jgi:hypothetical protein